MAAMLFFSVDFVSLPRSVDALSLLMFVCLFVCLKYYYVLHCRYVRKLERVYFRA